MQCKLCLTSTVISANATSASNLKKHIAEQYQFLYDTLEAVFPVQNGEVKAVQASAEVQIVNETKTAEQPAEAKAEQSASTTSDDQQGEAESAPFVADEVKEEPKEKPEVVSIPQTETSPPEETSNGPTASVEV